MRGFKYTLIGFFGFLVVTTFNISMGIVIYSYIEDLENWMIALIVLMFVIFSTIICSILDSIRRKVMIERPLNEILQATDQLARGNFNIKLIPNHSYEAFDEYDLIKDDLNRMARELSKSEVLKNDFIANVSHEIKTPLAVIKSYAKTLENQNLDSTTRQKYLENLQAACTKLNNLVINILKLNKLENQKLIPEITKFNISELLTNQVIQFVELIDKKSINLVCDIQEDLYINSNDSYLEIVFNNLISNAIKFTNDGGKITISLIKDKELFIIKIKDTGCGMDKETGIRIFDKFYQGDTSHSKEGNGLGLALVKKVIDVLGGSINVESVKGIGTTFTVTLKEV